MSGFALLLLTNVVAAEPVTATAADRIAWQPPADPVTREHFVRRWQTLRGHAPQLDAAVADATLRVANYPGNGVPTAALPDSPTTHAGSPNATPTIWLAVPRLSPPAAIGHSGIFAEPAPAEVLALWQRLLPDRHPAGVLVGPDRLLLWNDWQTAARIGRLTVRPGLVRAGEQPQRIFRLLRPAIGVLLYSAELAATDGLSLDVVLRESLSDGLPVLTTDPSLLPAGALAAISPSPADLGNQLAELGVALLNGRQPGWQEPSRLQLQLNYQVARSLQLNVTELDGKPSE